MDFMEFITPQAGIMIAVLWVIAEVIKRTEKVDNRWIPLILLIISVVATPPVLGGYNASNIVQGVLVLGAEMVGYQLWDKTITGQTSRDKI
jgi:steroid 5-alpha reductase family enzyme